MRLIRYLSMSASLISNKMIYFPGRILLNISFGVLVLANFIGNSIVCVVILRNKFMRTPVNYLLLNLAIADIMVGVFILPGPNVWRPYLYTHPGGTLGNSFCKTITARKIRFPRFIGVICLQFHFVSCCLQALSSRGASLYSEGESDNKKKVSIYHI